MPLPGGASNKAGLAYEHLWTAHCLTRVMAGDALSIHLEPPGEEGIGIEFTLATPEYVEHHQVKQQRAGRGVWSLKTLDNEGVLPHFRQKLNGDPTARCVFVSGHAAHPLDELTDRARKSNSWEEFVSQFINSREWRNNFDALHRLWNSADRRDTYNYLKRICVTTGDESTLRTMVCNKLEVLVGRDPNNADPNNALDILTQFALSQTHKRLGATDIWNHMAARGFHRKDWAQDPSIARKIAELNQVYRAGIKPLGGSGEVVPRTQQVEEVLSIFDDPDAKRAALLAGVAGVGKSSAVSQVIDAVAKRDWQILALRVDRLESCATPTAIGEQLGLPTSPASVLAGIAQGRDCLLVIDQLDAVSLTSGRNPEFFDCVGALMDQARSHPKMRVLAACREFDIKNDSRLRDLISEHGIASEVSIPLFDDATVRHIAAQIGLNADNLSSRQIKILSLPIHMRLLSEVVKSSGASAADFQTEISLFDRFWSEKGRILRAKGIGGAELKAAANAIVDTMNAQETLFVNEAALDEHKDAVDAMASENILVQDGAKYGFFHETFFDYLFARSATADPDFDLTQYILEREPQSLFLRSQVRQILRHQRAASPAYAARSAAALLACPNIRTHIKALVLSLLGSLDDPTQEDWDAIRPLMQSKLSSHAWNSIRGSLPWFDLLDSLGFIEQWMRGADQSLHGLALMLMRSVHEHRSSRIAELLSPFLANPTEDRKERLLYIVSLSEFGASKEYFDFVHKAFDAGLLDNSLAAEGNGAAWWQLKELVECEPDWACDLIATYCDRLLSIARSRGSANPFSIEGVDPHKSGGEAIINVAQASPIKFIDELMPFTISILKSNGYQSDSGRLSDPFVKIVHVEGSFSHQFSLHEAFFSALESAMRQIAEEQPDYFRGIVHLLRKYQCEDYPTIQQILIRAYAATGESSADEAIEYLLENHEIRFSPIHVQGFEAIRQLLNSSTPHCSTENLNRLEQAILGYYPKSDDTEFGDARQYILLGAIDQSRIAPQAMKRLQELRRKFGERELVRTGTVTIGEIGSPIPSDAAQKMSDENWLAAIKKHSQDSFDGGAHQLSRVLETEVRNAPTRFANLIHRIPDDANKMYFYAVLAGLADADVEMSLAISAVTRCHLVPGQPLGRPIARLLEKSLDAELPPDALDILAWYATKAPNPVGEPNWTTYVGGVRQEMNLQDILNAGLNTDRGAAAVAIARLLFHNENYLASFKPHLQSMVNDRSIAVRSLVAYVLLTALRYNRDLAVKLFAQLCAADDRLLGTRFVEDFIRYAATTHWDDIKPVIGRMLKSQIDEVAAAGARQACLASLTEEDAIPLAQGCVKGATALRLGAAQVYAANLQFSEHRAECQSTLETLFSAPNAEVRIAASRCFDRFDGNALASYESLIDAFVRSPAFKDGHHSLIHALTQTTARMPNAILSAAETFIATFGSDAADIRTGVAGYSTYIAQLSLRVYKQETAPSLRQRCLDLIDKMVEAQAHGAGSAIEEFER